MATTDVIAPPQDTRPRRAEVVRARLGSLFPDPEARPVARRTVLLGAAAVVAGTVVSLARTTGAGPFQSIWEEDARDLLTDAYMKPAAFNVFHPYVGYFQVVPRLMGQVAALFPVKLAAAALSVQAAVVCALLALLVYIASGAHLHHPLARVLVAAPMLFAPVAENVKSEIYNRPATVQFFAAYAMFWLLLWVPPTRFGRVVLTSVVALSAVSTFLVVAYIPLAGLRLYLRRDRVSLAVFGSLVAGGVLQVLGLTLHLTGRPFAVPRYDPVWALQSFVVWAVPHSVLGFRAARSINDVVHLKNIPLILLAWLVIAAIVVVAARRFTRPLWLLALMAVAHSVALCAMMIMGNGAAVQRYLLPVELLLLAALVVLLLPGDRLPQRFAIAPLALFTAALLIVSAFNYRWTDTYRAHAPLWTHQVDRAAMICKQPWKREVQVRSGPAPWYSLVTVPCHDVNRRLWCQDPYCVQVGALGTLANRPEATADG